MALQKDIKDTTIAVVTNRWLHHLAFWSVLLVLLVLLQGGKHSWFFSTILESINLICYATIVYFNLYYLIPNFLNERRLGMYFVLLGVSAWVAMSLKIGAFYWLFNNTSAVQTQLWADRNLYVLSNLLVAGSSTIFSIVYSWLRSQREVEELQTQNMQSELNFLKSQINPHFLFNTLNSLYALTLKKSDLAPEIVLRLSEMMRYMLYECNEKQVFLSKEVNYIQNYLELERLRQNKSIDLKFEVQGTLHQQTIAPLLFIPFIENCFKHGLSNHIGHGFVHILLKIEENQAFLSVINSKPDTLPMRSEQKSGGIGLVNVRRRLELLYPNNYTLNVVENAATYTINLTILL
jgi:two-component system, LytTR family, sensor kinase